MWYSSWARTSDALSSLSRRYWRAATFSRCLNRSPYGDGFAAPRCADAIAAMIAGDPMPSEFAF